VKNQESDSTESLEKDIQDVISTLMDRVIDKVLHADPFLKDEHKVKKPLYAALVPDEIFKGAHFERRFVTPFGGVWEKLAVAAAKHGLGFAEQSYRIDGFVKKGRLERISEVLNKLEHSQKGRSKTKPDWEKEKKYILAGKGEIIPTTVVCDVYATDHSAKNRFAFELKAPLPNSDQTKVSKEKVMKLYAMEPKMVEEAYFALPYNPYGKKEDYAWSFPARWFNMKLDPVVLIGDEFWEKIGGAGTYQMILKAVDKIGVQYRAKIYREYLGMEPPEGSLDNSQK